MKVVYFVDLMGCYDDYFCIYVYLYLILEVGNYDFVVNEVDQQVIFDQIDVVFVQVFVGEDC